MAKLSWISSLLAATIIVVILPIIYSKPQGFQYYSDYFPKSQQRRRIDDHPMSIKYQSGQYGYGQRVPNFPPIADLSLSSPIPNTSQKPKEVFVFLDERPYIKGKSLQHPSNIQSRTDEKKNQTSNSLPTLGKGAVILPENKDPLPRGKREQNSSSFKHLWNYQSFKPPTKWTWPTKLDIVFPDQPMPTTPPLGKVRPKCAKEGQVFCEEIENYPSAELEKILRSSPDRYLEAFGDDIRNTEVVQRVDVRIDTEEETLCDSEEKVIHPKVALTKDNEYEYIVNVANYTQGIRVEECKNANSSCRMTNNFPNGYKTECRQKYIYRNLLGYTKDGRVEKNLYQVPSCCQCVLKPNYSK